MFGPSHKAEMFSNAILLSLAAAVVAAQVDPRMPVITPAAAVERRDITIPTIDPNQVESDVNSVFSGANSVISDANSVISGAGSVVTSAVSDANSLISSAGSLVTSILSKTTTDSVTATGSTPTPTATHNEGPRQTGLVAAAAAIAGVVGAVVLL